MTCSTCSDSTCSSCTSCTSCVGGCVNPCFSVPCLYDCSPPLWATWPCINIKRCVAPCTGYPYGGCYGGSLITGTCSSGQGC